MIWEGVSADAMVKDAFVVGVLRYGTEVEHAKVGAVAAVAIDVLYTNCGETHGNVAGIFCLGMR